MFYVFLFSFPSTSSCSTFHFNRVPPLMLLINFLIIAKRNCINYNFTPLDDDAGVLCSYTLYNNLTRHAGINHKKRADYYLIVLYHYHKIYHLMAHIATAQAPHSIA